MRSFIGKGNGARAAQGEGADRYDTTSKAWAALAIARWNHESAKFSRPEEFSSGENYRRLDHGNTQPEDDKRFKGRGRVQFTGCANYAAMAKALGIDCMKNRVMRATSPLSELASAQWGRDLGRNAFCDNGDLVGLRPDGLEERKRLRARAKPVADDVAPRIRWSLVADGELRQLEILMTKPRIAARNGGWKKVDASRLPPARNARAWLTERVAQISKLPDAERDGWTNAGRKVVSGSSGR